jgi:PAS domain S-box-containing protein
LVAADIDIFSWRQSEQLPFFIISIDRNRIIKNINKVLPGFKKENVIGMSSDIFIAKEHHKLHVGKINSAFRNRRMEQFMISGHGINGDKTWYETHVIPVVKKGTSPYAYIISIDISAGKNAELASKESERALSTLMNNLPGMAYRCLYDDQWTMLFVSNGCEELTGYKKADIVDNKKISFANLVLPEDKTVGRREIKKAIKEREHFEIEYRIVTRKGKIKWIWEKGEGVFDERGKLLFIEGFIKDTTERKEQEIRLNQSRETYKNLVEQSPQGTFIHDLRGKILYANKATLDILGIKTLSQVRNLSMFDWILPEHHDQIAKDKKAIESGRSLGFKLSKIKTIKGSVVDIEYKPIAFTYNGNTAVLVVFHDISLERKLNEERVRAHIAETANIRLQKEIQERKTAEERVRHSLKEKEILLKEVHHRVKNNLQVISSILNLQSSYVNDAGIKNLLRESQNRIKSMAFIHESLYQTKDFSGIKFSDYIVNLSNNLVHTYISGGEKVELELKIDEIFLNLDSAIPCGLILNELVSNALKYAFPAKEKGQLFISLKQKNNEIEIVVNDNGRGLPPEIDFRNTQTLGLQLVNTLVDQLGGKIELDNSKGANYRITFKQKQKN